MTEIGMLSCMKTNSNRTSVICSNFKINIAHGGVERTGIGIRHRQAGWHNTRLCRGRADM